MRTKLLSLLLLGAFIFSSCQGSSSLCTLDDYTERYNARSEEFGFSPLTLSSSDSGVCGFAAFDGLFVVCLCTTEDGMIYTADISTGSEYSKLINGNEEKFEKALLSAAYLVSPLYIDSPNDEDISKIAGMILASIEDEKSITVKKGISLSGRKTTAGGFELEVSLI